MTSVTLSSVYKNLWHPRSYLQQVDYDSSEVNITNNLQEKEKESNKEHDN